MASILALPKSRERKLKWAELRNRGNFGHNTQVIKTGSGRIIPYRRPNSSTANANLQHFKGKSLDDIDVVADGMCLCLLLDYPYVPIQN